MEEIFCYFLITTALFGVFVYLTYKAIRTRKRSFFWSSLSVFIAMCIVGTYSVFLFMEKSLNFVADQVKPRNGIEIYTSLFSKPIAPCVDIVQHHDQITPRVDCCIWLEFYTCPEELARISAQHPYRVSKVSTRDTSQNKPYGNERPIRWKPSMLGDSIWVYRKDDNANRVLFMLVSKDSTHVLYQDMAD